MELSAAQEKDDYTSQEWTDYWESGGEEWPAEEWPEEPPPSLDALGRKGKGKGKGKGKDGKGKGKGGFVPPSTPKSPPREPRAKK